MPRPPKLLSDVGGALAAVEAATTAVVAARSTVDRADAQHAQLVGALVPPPQAEIKAAAAEAALRGEELSKRQQESEVAEAYLESLLEGS